MPAVQVRNLPQPTYSLLKAEARANGRSINKQTEAILVAHFAAQGTAAAPATAPDAALALDVANTPSTVSALGIGSTVPNPFLAELPADVSNRAARRAALFARIDKYPQAALPEGWDAASVVRAMRDER